MSHFNLPENDFRVSEADFQDILDTAGYAISYWAKNAKACHGVYLIWPDNARRTFTTRINVKLAMISINLGRVKVSDNVRNSVKQAVEEGNFSELDTHAVDVIIQIATFGELIYG